MVNELELEEDRVIYYLYNPSPFLHHNFELFKRYVTALKDNTSTRLLMFEAPTNLTQMELRAIDALHRYMAHLAKKDVEERVRLEKSIHGADISLSDADIKKEIKIVEEKLAKSLREKEEFEKKVPLCEVLKKVFGL
jgi:FKBP-type peptidyl-prolyl cis-trans isomerase (trigger factor)